MACDKTSDEIEIDWRIFQIHSMQDLQRAKLRSVLNVCSTMRSRELRKLAPARKRSPAPSKTLKSSVSRVGFMTSVAQSSKRTTFLAQAIMRAPKGLIALVSALAFRGLTDQIPQHG